MQQLLTESRCKRRVYVRLSKSIPHMRGSSGAQPRGEHIVRGDGAHVPGKLAGAW
jgi:hypothetical protein